MRITHLWRYPVKSLAGEPLAQTRLDRGGVPFDRQYIITDDEATRTGNALTARVVPDLLGYRAAVEGDAVRVTAPDGRSFAVDETLSSAMASALGRPLRIDAAPAGALPFHDAHDVLVINAASVRALSEEWSKPLDPVRFRPNIMLDGEDLPPYAEDDWVGRRFTAGDAVLEGVARDERCVLPTIDPRTLARDPSLLRLIVERHNQCFGLYCRVLTAGKIALGDEWRPL